MEDKILHKTKTYSLQIVPKTEQLQITLKLLTKNKKKTFKTILTNEKMPEQVQKNLRNVEMIYECFQDEQSFEVHEEERKITLRTFMLIRNKKIETLTALLLEQEQAQNDKVDEDIKFLKREILMLKNTMKQKDQKLQRNQKALNNLEVRIDEKLILMRSLFTKQYEKLYVQQKLSETEKLKTQNKLLSLETELEKSFIRIEKLQERNKNIEAFYESKLQKNEARTQVLQNKVGQILDKNKEMKKNICENKAQIKQVKIKSIKVNEQKKKQLFLKNQFSQFFKINQKQITYYGQNKKWTAFYRRQPLLKNKVYEFQFQIVKSSFNSIKIGLCNAKNTKSKRQPSTDHSISLSGDNGLVFVPQHHPGPLIKGFKQGNTLILKVDLKQRKINFIIKGKKGATLEDLDYLKDLNKQFVPFVCFYRYGDIVKWIK